MRRGRSTERLVCGVVRQPGLSGDMGRFVGRGANYSGMGIHGLGVLHEALLLHATFLPISSELRGVSGHDHRGLQTVHRIAFMGFGISSLHNIYYLWKQVRLATTQKSKILPCLMAYIFPFSLLLPKFLYLFCSLNIPAVVIPRGRKTKVWARCPNCLRCCLPFLAFIFFEPRFCRLSTLIRH